MTKLEEWWVVGAWFTADEWQAIWAFATFIVAAVAAFFALRQLRQNARAQLEQSRPYIIVDFAAPHGGGAIFIEIRNAGLTAAREISLRWNERPDVADSTAAQAMARWVFDGTIPFLAPGRSIRYYLGPFPDNEHRVFRVAAEYIGPPHQSWESESVLSFSQWGPAEVDKNPLLDIASHTKRLADIAEKMRRLAEATNTEIEAIADHHRETPEYQRSAARKLAINYERRRAMREAHARLAIRAATKQA